MNDFLMWSMKDVLIYNDKDMNLKGSLLLYSFSKVLVVGHSEAHEIPNHEILARLAIPVSSCEVGLGFNQK